MPALFYVDQAKSFNGVMFMSGGPKMGFGVQTQDKMKDGTPKWEAQVVVTYMQFGRMENEVIKVGIASHDDPFKALGNMPQPVELVGFRVGVTPVQTTKDQNGNERTTGGKAWYQADELRSTAQVPSGRKAAAAEG